MAIYVDDEVRGAVAQRRTRGRAAALALRLERVHHGGHALQVEWACDDDLALVAQTCGDVTVYLDRRVARYAQWHDVAISAWRLGPVRLLGVQHEPRVLAHMVSWEHSHPL